MLGEFLSPLLLISVIGLFVVALYLARAISSFATSQRRIADLLERLVRKLDRPAEKINSEKEWVLEEPSNRKLKNSLGAGPSRAQAGQSFYKPQWSKIPDELEGSAITSAERHEHE